MADTPVTPGTCALTVTMHPPTIWNSADLSIDWPNRIIYVPPGYLTLVSSSPTLIYELDVDQFRLDLKALEDDEQGMMWSDTHVHSSDRSLSGVDYPPFVEFINGYRIVFLPTFVTGTQGVLTAPYIVRLTNANTNIQDVVMHNPFDAWGRDTTPAEISVAPSNTASLVNLTEMTELLAETIAAKVQATIAANNTQAA